MGSAIHRVKLRKTGRVTNRARQPACDGGSSASSMHLRSASALRDIRTMVIRVQSHLLTSVTNGRIVPEHFKSTLARACPVRRNELLALIR
jgi:hypothetical protein